MKKIKQKTLDKAFAFLNSFENGKKYNGTKVRKKVKFGAAAIGVATKLELIRKEGKYYVRNKTAPFTLGEAETLCWGMNEYNRGLIATKQKGVVKHVKARILKGTNK